MALRDVKTRDVIPFAPMLKQREAPGIDPAVQRQINAMVDRGNLSKADEFRLRGNGMIPGIETQAELDRFRHNRQQRPGHILGRIIKAGGLEAQDRTQLSAMANRQLGMEVESLQQGYNRSLASAGGRQVGVGLRPYGNRLLVAQQQVQDNLNRLAMDRKQRALEMQLQIKEARQERKRQAKAQERAMYGDIIKTAFKIGTSFIPGIGPAGSSGASGDIGQGMPSGPMSFGLPSGPQSFAPPLDDPYFGSNIA